MTARPEEIPEERNLAERVFYEHLAGPKLIRGRLPVREACQAVMPFLEAFVRQLYPKGIHSSDLGLYWIAFDEFIRKVSLRTGKFWVRREDDRGIETGYGYRRPVEGSNPVCLWILRFYGVEVLADNEEDNYLYCPDRAILHDAVRDVAYWAQVMNEHPSAPRPESLSPEEIAEQRALIMAELVPAPGVELTALQVRKAALKVLRDSGAPESEIALEFPELFRARSFRKLLFWWAGPGENGAFKVTARVSHHDVLFSFSPNSGSRLLTKRKSSR